VIKRTPPPPDNFLRNAVMLALLVVALGFAAAWFYFKPATVVAPFTYTDFGPIVVRTSQYSVKTKLSLQTSNDHAKWANENRIKMKAVLENTMAGLDFDQVRSPGGVAYVENTLRAAANKQFQTHNVEKILLTDFVIQSN
jgi:flagellar basal body-associated protein FliL